MNLWKRYRAWRCRRGHHAFTKTPSVHADGYSWSTQYRCEHCGAVIWGPYEFE